MLTPLTSAFKPRNVYDVCVIGAGVAGITLAVKLRKLGLSVFLAEGGGKELSEESQQLYRGKVSGDPYFDLDATRLRYFGGTSNHWGGWCRPLEAFDFKAKRIAPQTVWPIEKGALDPHLDEARKILEIPKVPPDIPLDPAGALRRVHFVFSPPVRFAGKFGKDIAADTDIHACLNCNATGLDFRENRIERVRFQNFHGHIISIAARAFVLACGGIENNRLLLYWNRSTNNVLGNSTDNVGRYWMEHLTQTIGGVVFCDGFSLPDDRTYPPYSQEHLFVAPTERFMVSEGILNCRIRLDRLPTETCKAPSWIGRLLNLSPSRQVRMARVRSSSEQEPVAENRVILDRESDRFGIPRPILKWRRSALDKKTFRSVALALGAYFAGGNRARLKLHDWLLSESLQFKCEGSGSCPGGNHHLGGTRMAGTPKNGVVDTNARVFGTKNLFVAGSSVFASGGFCNPTLTIVQLSLRLAEHLAAVAPAASDPTIAAPNRPKDAKASP